MIGSNITRNGVRYQQLTNGTLTCGPLDQSGMIGGTGEYDRNYDHNPERMHRILQFCQKPKVLDYGCGSGLLVEFLRDNGIDAEGYDKYLKKSRNHIFNGDLGFSKDHYDVVTMIEVIEHTAAPYLEIQEIFHVLKPGGVLMVETSFTDWMDLDTDPYINPMIGHSTIFSHQGLDEVMKEQGFETYGHINRNVRVYQKPAPLFSPKITLITMGQGNPVALKRTIESFKHVVDEIVFGDVLIFDQDRETISKYAREYNFRMVKLRFNFIFDRGFADTLNQLAEHATHDWILYMNVGEVLDGEHFIKEQMSERYNCYPQDHAVETHQWYRLYNRKEVKWGGRIHEEVVGDLRRCPFNILRFADTEKDLDDPFRAKVANDVKEVVYWAQYLMLVERPEAADNVHPYWIQHAREAYGSYMGRMHNKGKRYKAFVESNLSMYLEDIYTNPEFEKERFESSELINFQGDRKLL